jgi:hypothetical protein
VLLASKAFKMLLLPAAPVLPELAPPPHAPSTIKLLNTANSAATLRESLTISMPSFNIKSVMHGLLSSPDMLGFKNPPKLCNS